MRTIVLRRVVCDEFEAVEIVQELVRAPMPSEQAPRKRSNEPVPRVICRYIPELCDVDDDVHRDELVVLHAHLAAERGIIGPLENQKWLGLAYLHGCQHAPIFLAQVPHNADVELHLSFARGPCLGVPASASFSDLPLAGNQVPQIWACSSRGL